jgi:hypothetical protein
MKVLFFIVLLSLAFTVAAQPGILRGTQDTIELKKVPESMKVLMWKVTVQNDATFEFIGAGYVLQENGATIQATVFQSGNNNLLDLHQGANDTGRIRQIGVNNEASLWQGGGGNNAAIRQTGKNNMAVVIQNGIVKQE